MDEQKGVTHVARIDWARLRRDHNLTRMALMDITGLSYHALTAAELNRRNSHFINGATLGTVCAALGANPGDYLYIESYEGSTDE